MKTKAQAPTERSGPPARESRSPPRPWTVLAILGVLFLLVASGGYRFYRAQERELRRRAEQELLSIARLKADQIRTWRAERLADGEVLMESALFVDAVTRWLAEPEAAPFSYIRSRADAMIRCYHYAAVKLLGPDGTPLWSSDGALFSLHPEAIRTMERAMAERRPVLTDIHADPVAHKAHLGVVVPLFAQDGDGRALGAILLVVNLDHYVFPLIQSWPVPSESAETLIVRRDGDDALFLNALRHQEEAALSLRIPLTHTNVPAVMAIRGRQGVVEGEDYRGVDVLSVLSPVPDSPWFMITKVDSAEVFRNWRRWVLGFLALITMMLVAVGALAGLFWQREQKKHYQVLVQARSALRASETRLQRFYESPLLGILYWNMDGRIVDANDKFLAMIGYTRDDLEQGRIDWVAMTPPEFRHRDEQSVAELKATGVNQAPFEKVYLRKDGSRLPILVAGAMLDPERFNGVAFVLDISERKKAEENVRCLTEELESRVKLRTAQLEASNKELEAFAYSVSHDLRAPLRAIDGFSKILAEDYGARLEAEGTRLLGIVRESVQRMDQLIGDLLTLSRATRAEMNMARLDMQALARAAYEDAAPAALRDTFEFSVADLPAAWGDPVLLRQVWFNLLNNAVKYSGPSRVRRIEVGGRSEGTVCEYFVRDAGVGFDPKYAHKLFGPFQRLHRASEFEGTGIGLAIVQRIVYRHGGRVWADGKVGEGATFGFALPKG